MTSTSSSVSRTRSLSRCPSSVRGRCSPGVSTRTSWRVGPVTMPRMVCRVVCGLLEVMATFCPTSALVSVDLPALGRPTRHAKPATGSPSCSRCVAHPARSSISGAPCVPARPARRRTVAMRWRRPAIRSAVRRSPATSHVRAGDRHPPDGLADQPADGVDLVLVEVDVEQLGEVVDVQRGARPGIRPSPSSSTSGGLAVVLVGDLADDLLEDVLDRDQPGRAAVLVDDDRDVDLVALHLAQQVVDRLALGHEAASAASARATGTVPASGSALTPAHDVLEVEQADDVVDVVADAPGCARSPERRNSVIACRQVRSSSIDDHVGARHHDLAHDGVAELEDRVDHLALARLDQRGVARPVDEVAQLGSRSRTGRRGSPCRGSRRCRAR